MWVWQLAQCRCQIQLKFFAMFSPPLWSRLTIWHKAEVLGPDRQGCFHGHISPQGCWRALHTKGWRRSPSLQRGWSTESVQHHRRLSFKNQAHHLKITLSLKQHVLLFYCYRQWLPHSAEHTHVISLLSIRPVTKPVHVAEDWSASVL